MLLGLSVVFGSLFYYRGRILIDHIKKEASASYLY
jgi:hypothetical protein